MKRYLALSLILMLNWSCRSADKSESTPQSVKAPEQIQQSVGNEAPEPDPRCATRPAPRACCEALTPACNQCREEARAEQVAWEEACLPEASDKPECSKPPSVSDCCSDYTEACESCRKKAAATLLAWKASCGTYEAHSCDKQPPTSMCCQAMIPSCQQCKDRNRRIRQEWEDRCLQVTPKEN